MKKLNKIKVAGVEYEIGDSIKTIEIADSFNGDIISETIRQILSTSAAAENEIIKVRDRLFCKYEKRTIDHPLSHVTLYYIYIDLHELATGITYKYKYPGKTSLPNTNEQPTYTTINDQNQRVFYAELTDTTMTIQEFVDSLPVSKLYDNSNTTKINGPIIVRHKDSSKLYNTYLFNFNCDIKNNVNTKNKVSVVNLSTGVMYETQDWNITFADLFGSGLYGNYYLESDYLSYGRKAYIRGSTSSAQTLPEYEQDNYNRIGEIWVTGTDSNPKVHLWTEVDYEGCQWVELTGSSDYYNKSAIDNLLKNKALAATADAYSGSNTLDNLVFIHAMFSYCRSNNVGLESSENTSSGVLFNGRYLVSIKNVEANIYKMYISDLREHKYYEYAGQDNTGINTYPSFDSSVFKYKTEYSFQPKLTAGEGISISEDNIISANIDLSSKQDVLTAGEGITIDENNVISATGNAVNDSSNVLVIQLSDITEPITDYKKLIGRIFWYIYRNYIMDADTAWLINENTPLNYKVISTNAIGEITYEVSITNTIKYSGTYPNYDGYITIQDLDKNKVHIWKWENVGSGDYLGYTTLTLNATSTTGTLFSVSDGDNYKLEYNTTGVSVYYENKKTIELNAENGMLILGAPGEEVYLDCAGIEHNGGFLSYKNIADKNYVTTTAYTKDEVNNKLTKKADLDESGKVPASQLPSDTSNNMIFVEPSEIITLVPNQYHILDAQVPSNITLNLQDYNPNETSVYREYMGEIRVDETETIINLPEGIRWNEADEVDINASQLTLGPKQTYLFSILNYIGLIKALPNPTLDRPTVTLEGTILSIGAVPNASSYSVKKDSVLLVQFNEAQSIDLSEYIDSTAYGAYQIWVYAHSNYYTDSSYPTVYYVSTTLDTPTNLVVNESNTLSWDSVENATNYTITLVETGSTKTVATNLCDLTTFTELATAGTYTFNIKATNASHPAVYLPSNVSESITVTITGE